MAGEKISTTKCDCGDGGTVEWSKTKTGGVSGKCLTCGEQRFKRSPSAVERFMRQISGAPASSAGAGEKKDEKKGGGLLGDPLDLSKL